jgi:glycosyltransferase involved in cell wall biosynthesis
LRIAVITTSYPAHAGDAAGHFVESEVRELLASGHDVTVITPRVGDGAKYRDAALVRRIEAGTLFGWPGARARLAAAPWRALGGARFVLGARRELEALERVDRVIAHWIVPSAFPIALCRNAPLEIVAHGSDVRLLLELPARVRRRLLGVLLAHGAEFRFVSEALRVALVAAGHPELLARSRVEPCSVDVSDAPDRRSARRALGLVENARVVVVVGRLVAEKRIDSALRAAALLPRADVVVVGDGPERTRLERAFPDARFVGKTPRPIALSWLVASDLLIATSLREGAPTVVREARALGVPVVACPAGDLQAWSERDAELYVVSSASNRRAPLRYTYPFGTDRRRTTDT